MLTNKEDNYIFKIIGAVVATLVLLYLTWQLSAILILMITAVIIVATLNPIVAWLERKMQRKYAASLVIIVLILPIVFVLATIVPVFLDQVNNIAVVFTRTINHFPFLPRLFQNIDISQYTKEAGQYLIDSTSALTSFVTQIIILIFTIYYILIDEDRLYNLISKFIPEEKRVRVDHLLSKLSDISGQYIRGNIFISFICGTVIFIGLFILRVPGASVLAVFAAITDLLPLIGATLGAIPAIVLAFSVSPLTGLLTTILFWLYQQIENDWIIPRVYSSALKIIPFLSFISVIVGTILFGMAGAFLALPIAASIPTIVHYFFEEKHHMSVKRLRVPKKQA